MNTLTEDTPTSLNIKNKPLIKTPSVSINKKNIRELNNISSNDINNILTIKNEVASVTIAPHGGFIVVACSDGSIYLFNTFQDRYINNINYKEKLNDNLNNDEENIILDDIIENESEYLYLGQVQAKGLHTKSIIRVLISEDSRFIVTGKERGSLDVIIFDIGKLPIWNETINYPNLTYSNCNSLIKKSIHHSSRLKGVGNVTKYIYNNTRPEYRILAGYASRNFNLWSFLPEYENNNGEYFPEAWVHIATVSGYGQTIEHLSFFDHGNKVLSKSVPDMPVRYWDFTSVNLDDIINNNNEDDDHDNDSSSSSKSDDDNNKIIIENKNGYKPEYQDISNSNDAKLILSGYIIGGKEQLSFVKVDADEWANRTEIELKLTENDENNEKNKDKKKNINPYKSSSRRKRIMKSITNILGTYDGEHLIVLCSDGTSYYITDYKNSFNIKIMEINLPNPNILNSFLLTKQNYNNKKNNNKNIVKNPSCLPDASCLKYVGKNGLVTYITSYWIEDEAISIINISSLKSIIKNLNNTRLIDQLNNSKNSNNFNESECYFNKKEFQLWIDLNYKNYPKRERQKIKLYSKEYDTNKNKNNNNNKNKNKKKIIKNTPNEKKNNDDNNNIPDGKKKLSFSNKTSIKKKRKYERKKNITDTTIRKKRKYTRRNQITPSTSNKLTSTIKYKTPKDEKNLFEEENEEINDNNNNDNDNDNDDDDDDDDDDDENNDYINYNKKLIDSDEGNMLLLSDNEIGHQNIMESIFSKHPIIAKKILTQKKYLTNYQNEQRNLKKQWKNEWDRLNNSSPLLDDDFNYQKKLIRTRHQLEENSLSSVEKLFLPLNLIPNISPMRKK